MWECDIHSCVIMYFSGASGSGVSSISVIILQLWWQINLHILHWMWNLKKIKEVKCVGRRASEKRVTEEEGKWKHYKGHCVRVRVSDTEMRNYCKRRGRNGRRWRQVQSVTEFTVNHVREPQWSIPCTYSGRYEKSCYRLLIIDQWDQSNQRLVRHMSTFTHHILCILCNITLRMQRFMGIKVLSVELALFFF